MALPSIDYTPRDPAADVLHRVVREHLQTFLAEAAHRRDGEALRNHLCSIKQQGVATTP